MRRAKGRSRGFTLIAALLVLAMLSAIAVSLLFMVHGAGQVGNNDLETNRAYYGAESGMELLTANLAALYQQSQSPTPAQITALTTNPPDSTMINGMNYQETISWTPDANGNPASSTGVIGPGSNESGLTAEIIPLTLKVVATRPGGASVNMTRGVEVALIPVFQFGVFSDSDLSYFAGPNFDFQGRVHTNGNLFLGEGNGNALVLDDKVTAVKQIIRDRLANNFPGNTNYTGDVYVLNQTGGCDGTVATAINSTLSPHCLKFTVPMASWSGGIPAAGTQTNVSTWTNTSTTVSATTFGGFIGNGTSMAVQPLQLPFVQGATNSSGQIQIIRKRTDPTELPTSALGSSREYNKANIRILLADTLADLHPDRGTAALDVEDVNLGGASFVIGGNTYFLAQAKTTVDGKWVSPPSVPSAPSPNPWNLVDGYLRVEYKDAGGNWHGVTNQWLQLGFARSNVVPTAPSPSASGNSVFSKAILLLQQRADRDGDGNISSPNDNPVATFGANSQYDWYPINFYDPREGFPRDFATLAAFSPVLTAGTQGYANGIMNAVEIDVGNLKEWLNGTIAGSGTQVEYTSQNGYLLYFSDRRGMLPDPNALPTPNVTTGEYGFEDTINSGSAFGTPDNNLEPPSYYAFSPEDVDMNNQKDNWGAANVGNGFHVATALNPYKVVDCFTVGRQNKVTGARHVLRLIDGSLGNLPVRLDNGLGGFTVASENPVYILGNYNSNAGDPFWNNQTAADIAHSNAAVIADSVTLLSNNWSDLNDMKNPVYYGAGTGLANRTATSTYYRLAIAGGKNINFPQPAGTGNDFGTDGGVHNFLRYIEAWGGAGGLYYRGSLVSLYYSQYATGIFKCCNQVYGPPNRQYYFDSSFLDPTKLPPGTPMLQDVVNLTYWQDFRPY
jgi:hypothetical protein